MNKILLKARFAPVLALVLFAVGNTALADEVTGRLTTGISGNVGTTTMDGIVISPPIANPPAGAYDSAQSVTMTAVGATSIVYTTDGTAPVCSTGNAYSNPIPVNSSLVIEARSCYTGNASSTVASYLYAINIPSGGNNTVTSQVSNSSGGGGGGSGGLSLSLFSKGDSNGDGKVNILDFVVLMANWGKTGSGNLADFNSDGKVDITDFVTLMANWTNQ